MWPRGEEIPRKGGPAVTKSDVLVINKTDLAPYVGADLEVMRRDACAQRQEKPFFFAQIKHDQGVQPIEKHLVGSGGPITRKALTPLQRPKPDQSQPTHINLAEGAKPAPLKTAGPGRYLPLKTGLRRSLKAKTPSRRSCVGIVRL
jgi:hypothetical protein